ncbi:MAG: glycosyltransferase family 2 protein [Candidatus Lokiarchaeia archaeon]
MNILDSEKRISLSIKPPVLEQQKIPNFRFQELYNYLNQFNNEEDQILLSLIIPAYNEEKSIKQLLRNLPNDKNIEIIVIDDNSTDNSLKEIQKVNGQRKIKLLKHKENIGYGGSVITGVKHAKGNVIVTMDSDGQHCPGDIIQLIKPILEDEADFTIGSRYLGRNYYELPIRTRLGEAIIEKLLRICFGQKIMNSQNGFRAFNRKMIPILKEAKYNRFVFATEVLILTLIYKKRIKECPIKVYEREYGSSKISLLTLIFNLLTCFLKYYYKKIKLTIIRRNRK